MPKESLFKIKQVSHFRLKSVSNSLLRKISDLLPNAEVIEVGSTAIPGMIGKQDIDFLVRVPAKEFEATRRILDKHFSRDDDQLSNDMYQGYSLTSEFDASIQLTIKGSKYDRFTDFLEILENDVSVRSRYASLKRRWHGRSMEHYREEKADFIADVLESNTQPQS